MRDGFALGGGPCHFLDRSSFSAAGARGALTGTTGTDGNLTISVSTSPPYRLYIENRTGCARTYSVAFEVVESGSTQVTIGPLTAIT